MSAPAIPVPRLVPRDVELLERRARELAGGEVDAREGGGGALRAVAFRLRGAACAVDAAVVERTLSLLAGAISVPLVDGSQRSVAFVDERPLPLADLAGLAAGAGRCAGDLRGSPALVLATADGPVAVAVDGPLELAEEDLAATAAEELSGERIRLAGRLAGGAILIDSAWLLEWATQAVRA